jgi:hypothetical protein
MALVAKKQMNCLQVRMGVWGRTSKPNKLIYLLSLGAI